SMKALFHHPDFPRQNKITRTDRDIVIPLGPKVKVNGEMRGIEIRLPKGMPVTLIGSIDQRKMVEKILADIAAEDDAAAGFSKFKKHLQDLHDQGAEGFAKYLRQQKYINCGQPLNQTGEVDFADLEEDVGH